MSNISTTPQRKQSNASGVGPGDLAEQVSSRAKRELEDDESEGDEDEKPEKRAGRRKIKIEYIDDKSRRHITFSKRKAGIMKKAYELSTLTGTQVLLLVVSETGLVYTFTTPKLQPLVTKPEGKNLIQTCLNAPDNPPTTETAAAPTRQAQTPPVYPSDNSPPVENNDSNIYNDNDRKHPSPSGQNLATHNNYQQLGLSGYSGQYSIPANNLPMNPGGLPASYMSTNYQPQHSPPQYIGQQYSPNSTYMSSNMSSNYWTGGSNGNGNANGKVQQQFPNQTNEKKQ
ncbi:9184_t:CDS:2 [Ambispora gerdemannii]|uniref:9184_t:CDS:1 n=1 Tax=Ambispora gerdemannii TaxID=144530 RepID=A0A9N9CVL3_9GLOM|nr:9184_t:CDS:2 [Ambispora gerdemannii]